MQFRPLGSGANAAYVTTSGNYVSVPQGTLWGSSNDGSGSGLDADTLDTVQLDDIVYGNYKGTFANVTMDANNVDRTGTYTSGAFTNRPSGTSWTYLDTKRLYSTDNNYNKQISYDTYNNNMWTRTESGGVWSDWYKIWNSYNHGIGSGLDADLLDGLHATSFVRAKDRTNWNTSPSVLGNVVGQLGWKNYGINHTIFDASASTTPSGTSCSDADAAVAWTGTYPTLMGWNGSQTYGVRVDSARNAGLLDGFSSSRFTRINGPVIGNWNSIFGTSSSYTTGIYEVQNITGGAHSNYPTGVYTYGGVFAWRSASSTFKLYASHTGDLAYQTGWGNDGYSGWRNVLSNINIGTYAWTSSNDGSGSGLDADTVDNVQASAMVQLTATQTITGQKYFRSDRNTTSNSPPLQAYSSGGGGAIMSFHRAGLYAINFGLDSDNVIRIGGWSAATNRFQMDMSGNLTMAGNITAYSDIRLKENIKVIPDALSKVQQLRGVTFTRNDTEDLEKLHTGVIAQEVEAVLPEAVSEDNDGIKNVAYGNMVGLLIESIKELKTEVDNLKTQLENK